MTRYLMSVDDGATTQPEEEPDAGTAPHEEGQDTDEWLFGGGLKGQDLPWARSSHRPEKRARDAGNGRGATPASRGRPDHRNH
jgi:hypothetical protein